MDPRKLLEDNGFEVVDSGDGWFTVTKDDNTVKVQELEHHPYVVENGKSEPEPENPPDNPQPSGVVNPFLVNPQNDVA